MKIVSFKIVSPDLCTDDKYFDQEDFLNIPFGKINNSIMIFQIFNAFIKIY